MGDGWRRLCVHPRVTRGRGWDDGTDRAERPRWAPALPRGATIPPRPLEPFPGPQGASGSPPGKRLSQLDAAFPPPPRDPVTEGGQTAATAAASRTAPGPPRSCAAAGRGAGRQGRRQTRV